MSALKSCETCMQMNTAEQRQQMGCGYEPAIEHGPLWTPEAFPLRTGDLTTCSGYTVRLPEVFEIARARAHWHKGALDSFLGREQPSEQLMICIDIMESSSNELELARVTPKSEGGLAEERRP